MKHISSRNEFKDTMMLRLLLAFSLIFGVSSEPEPDTYQLLVNLFNALFVDSVLSFEYEFGSGVSLLNGKAVVTIEPPLELLHNSTVTYPDVHTQLCTLEVHVPKNITITQKNKPGLVLTGCHIELDTTIKNESDWMITPVLLWVYDCNNIEHSDGTTPPIPDQVLPTLSQGMYNTAVDFFQQDFDEAEDIKSDPSQNIKIFQEMFSVLLYLKGRPIKVQKSK